MAASQRPGSALGEAPALVEGMDTLRGLYANEAPRAARGERPMKVRLPLRQHIELHRLRITTGAGISETVTAALEHYFERKATERTRETDAQLN